MGKIFLTFIQIFGFVMFFSVLANYGLTMLSFALYHINVSFGIFTSHFVAESTLHLIQSSFIGLIFLFVIKFFISIRK